MSKKQNGFSDGCALALLIGFWLFVILAGVITGVVQFLAWWRIAFGD